MPFQVSRQKLARYQWTDGFPPPLEEKIIRLAAAVMALPDNVPSTELKPVPNADPTVHPTTSPRAVGPQPVRPSANLESAAPHGLRGDLNRAVHAFVLSIEDVFFIAARGTSCVVGVIENGPCRNSQRVAILKDGVEVRRSVVIGIEMSRKLLETAETGDKVGLLLRGVAKGELEPGMVVRGLL